MRVHHLLCPGEGEVGEEGRVGELQEAVEVGDHVSTTQVDPGGRPSH